MRIPSASVMALSLFLVGVASFPLAASFQPSLPLRSAVAPKPLCKAPCKTSSSTPKWNLSSLHFSPAVATTLPVAAKAGVVAVTAQWILAKLVFSNRNKLCPKVVQETADYTAHSVVALGLMILLSGWGIRNWWLYPTYCSGGVAKILNVSLTAQWMAAVVLGSFVLWDIPVSTRIQALRKPDVLAHHCVMTMVAAIGCFLLPMEYGVYYFGIVELSSIPLICYDQVTHWVEHLQKSKNTKGEEKHALEIIQGNLGLLAGISFTLVRVVSFTKVTLRDYLPDSIQALAVASTGSQKWAIRILMGACAGFTVLQWYWFSTMIKAFQEGGV